jgi:hypothetical protein
MKSSYSIQFQKGISLAEFIDTFGTEEKCRNQLEQMRWPNGFVCPNCASTKAHALNTRPVLQCSQCRKQTSLIANTLFHNTKLPLKTWFLAIYMMSQTKTGMSSIELSRHLGVQQKTAWLLQHKLMDAMTECESGRVLRDSIEIDDAYIGGRCPGQKVGRGSPNKVPFVIAVDKNEKNHPRYLVLSVLPNFQKKTLEFWACMHIKAKSLVISDGLNGFRGIQAITDSHIPVKSRGDKAILDTIFYWTSTVLSNLKTSLTGVQHKTTPSYLFRFFGLFQFRFNRRYNLKALFYSTLRLAATSMQRSHRKLKLAESCA